MERKWSRRAIYLFNTNSDKVSTNQPHTGCAQLFIAGDLCPCYHNKKLMTQQLEPMHNQHNTGAMWKPVKLGAFASARVAVRLPSETEKVTHCVCALWASSLCDVL